jgi:hypothetical protein
MGSGEILFCMNDSCVLFGVNSAFTIKQIFIRHFLPDLQILDYFIAKVSSFMASAICSAALRAPKYRYCNSRLIKVYLITWGDLIEKKV